MLTHTPCQTLCEHLPMPPPLPNTQTPQQGWTPDEEAAFLSGLEAHGRDWKAIAADIGSRDSRAVASHAQKHFIRCCMAGTPLPPRVLESGRGYTLSGNLLDPSSAAAAAYGFKYDLLLTREFGCVNVCVGGGGGGWGREGGCSRQLQLRC
jgi:SHAQKYF class myb-like DNA-binding protein